jgi:hypothetical protein
MVAQEAIRFYEEQDAEELDSRNRALLGPRPPASHFTGIDITVRHRRVLSDDHDLLAMSSDAVAAQADATPPRGRG